MANGKCSVDSPSPAGFHADAAVGDLIPAGGVSA